MSEKRTTIPLKVATRERLKRCGLKGDTWDDITNILIGETRELPSLESAFAEAREKAEESKKTGLISLSHEASEIALSALKGFIKHVKQRSE